MKSWPPHFNQELFRGAVAVAGGFLSNKLAAAKEVAATGGLLFSQQQFSDGDGDGDGNDFWSSGIKLTPPRNLPVGPRWSAPSCGGGCTGPSGALRMAATGRTLEPGGAVSTASFFGLSRAAVGVLATIAGLGLAEHIWRGFLGPHIRELTGDLGTAVWVMAGFSAVLNLVEGFAYIAGGTFAHQLGARKTLAISALPILLGLLIFSLSQSALAVVITALLITNWEPLSLAATFDVVGGEVPKDRRTTAFALQSIQKRLPQVIGPLVGGALFGLGFGWNLGLAFALLAAASLTQWRLLGRMKARAEGARLPTREVLARIPRPIRRLLTAEIILRWSDWLVRDLAALYVVGVLMRDEGEWGLYLSLAAFAALATYVPVGRWVDRSPSPRPFIGLTFFLFALFPLNLALLPELLPVPIALGITYVLNGLREIGEPARKALITTGLPAEVRARGVGLYWGIRSFAFWPAPLAAAALWTFTTPQTTLLIAGGVGLVGCAAFYALVPRDER